MSQPDFDAAALELVREFGTTGIYTQVITGSYDPSLGMASLSEISTPVNIVILDLTKQVNGLSLKYATEIIAGDKEAYVIPPNKTGYSALNTVDTVNDKITVSGTTYSVVNMKEINPTGNDPIVYTFYLRR